MLFPDTLSRSLMLRFLFAPLVALLILVGTVTARAGDPAVPPGQDPGGHAIALIGAGVDYRSDRITPRLARDGEGEIVGWDFVDSDRHPFPASAAEGAANGASLGDTTAAEVMLAAYANGRLVPVRLAGNDGKSLARAIGFAIGTPARVIAITLPVETAELSEVVRQASERFRDHLFVVQTGFAGSAQRQGAGAASAPAPVPGSLMNLGNVLVVTSGAEADGKRAEAVLAAAEIVVIPRGSSMFGAPTGSPPRNGAEAVAMAAAAAACQSHGREALLGSAAKAATIDLARPLEQTPAVKALDPMCWYGGKKL